MMDVNEFYAWDENELRITRHFAKAANKMNDVEMLRLSVEKFKLIKQKALHDRGIPNWSGIDSCPLCIKYIKYNMADKVCSGCPIREFTGKAHCESTPYMNIYPVTDWKSSIVEVENEIKFLNKIIRKLVRQKSKES